MGFVGWSITAGGGKCDDFMVIRITPKGDARPLSEADKPEDQMPLVGRKYPFPAFDLQRGEKSRQID
jgi:hypothetical protein